MKCPSEERRDTKIILVGCQKCGNEIEFFSDESSRKCSTCGTPVSRPVEEEDR